MGYWKNGDCHGYAKDYRLDKKNGGVRIDFEGLYQDGKARDTKFKLKKIKKYNPYVHIISKKVDHEKYT